MSHRKLNFQAMGGMIEQIRNLESYIATTDIERSLIHLVKLRASQINGCAYCMAMHTEEALAEGERVDRLSVVRSWREAPWFSEREQAALAWTESLTRLADGPVPDDVFDRARDAFGEKGLGDLTLVVITINAWNRISVPFQNMPKAFDHPAVLRAAAD